MSCWSFQQGSKNQIITACTCSSCPTARRHCRAVSFWKDMMTATDIDPVGSQLDTILTYLRATPLALDRSATSPRSVLDLLGPHDDEDDGTVEHNGPDVD